MRFFEHLLRWLGLLIIAVSTAACSETVTWEEEVPLNTGETVWIKRTMPWELSGGYGNPLDIARRPTREQTIEFEYGGRRFGYTGRAHVLWIAISPKKQPVLVAPAASFGWYRQNNYYCVVPYYVQLEPDSSGKRWTWPERIEPWLYELEANVMASIPLLDEKRQARYTKDMRDQRDLTYRLQFPAAKKIDPNYKEVSGCLNRRS